MPLNSNEMQMLICINTFIVLEPLRLLGAMEYAGIFVEPHSTNNPTSGTSCVIFNSAHSQTVSLQYGLSCTVLFPIFIYSGQIIWLKLSVRL